MNLPLGRSPRLSAHLDRITKETADLDRELDAQEMAKQLHEEFDRQVTRFLRRVVPTKASK